MSIQEQIIKDLHVKPIILVKEEIQARIQFLKKYLVTSKAKGFVLGISGGQDSTLAGRLAQLAVEELRVEGHEAKFIAVRLPYHQQADEADAQAALQFIQPDETITFNIGQTVDVFNDQFSKATANRLSDFNKGNVKARARMMAQYAINGLENLLVIGTDQAAEALTGFFTKYGDGGADILPLSGLTKRQGRALLIELGAPELLYLKAPTADLLDEKPQHEDETELGISYELLDDYLEGEKVPPDIARKIEQRYIITQHKRHLPVSMFDVWWK